MDFPNILTKNVATRSPRPVWTKPLAKKNARTMSQMTSFVMAENACWKVSVLVTTVMERPQKAQAPTGRGVRTRPVMVERKMARRVHARGSTAAGHGTTNWITRPTATEMSAGTILAPFHVNPEGAASAAATAAGGFAADATGVDARRRARARARAPAEAETGASARASDEDVLNDR